MPRKQLRTVLDFGARCLAAAGRRLYRSDGERRVAPWFAARGDATLRLDYDLNAESLVLDVGGFEGQWASDIFARSSCRVHVFEPCPEFALGIARRFAQNPRIQVHPFGLAGASGQACLALAGDKSSVYLDQTAQASVQLMAVDEFFREHDISHVDLMKINIEGGEYDLLERMLDAGLVALVDNLQIQFHDFVPLAPQRMEAIQRRLEHTHEPTWQYRFVWENWRKRSG